MKEEYTRETYPSFGKKYNSERGIISLTSWRARINTVSKTLFSLLKQCPGFHIVLVLSEEEFPKMMDELPDNLKLFVDNGLIEILWVYKNYKSFKKWIFTADKYRDVPIISADDGCIYIRNYAEELFQNWLSNKNKIISIKKFKRTDCVIGGSGYGMLFPPFCKLVQFSSHLTSNIIETNDDDYWFGFLCKREKINILFLNSKITFKNLPECFANSLEKMRLHK